MLRVLKFELYAAFRNRLFWALFVMIVVLSVPMTGVGAKRTVRQVLVFDTGISNSYTAVIQAIRGQEYFAFYDGINQKYLIESEAVSLLKPGGPLYQKYGWLLEKEYTQKQYIEGNYYPADAENVYETCVFERILRDYAAILLLGMIFAAYFFGQDFVLRGFSTYVIAGRSRTEILVGKFSAYLALSLLLSLVVLVTAIINFVPKVFVLGYGYVMRCVGTRLIIDVGFLSVPVIFPFIFRDILKSAGVCLLFMILFLSNQAIVNLHLFDFYSNSALFQRSFSLKPFLLVLLTTIGIFAAVAAGSYLLFRRAQLK